MIDHARTPSGWWDVRKRKDGWYAVEVREAIERGPFPTRTGANLASWGEVIVRGFHQTGYTEAIESEG